MSEQTVEVACTLTSTDLSRQQERWAVLRADAELGRTDTDDGLRLRFRRDEEIETELRALTAIENECCSWANWSVEARDGEVVLAVSSAGDGVAAAQALFD
jgi:hypothetical protein